MELDEMRTHRLPLDDATADRLAAGELHPHDAPPGYAGVARLLTDAPLGPAGTEIGAELLGAMVRAIDSRPTNVRTRPVLSKLLTAKVATAVAAVAFATTGAAAAATGNLPDPAQDAVSDAVSHVGLELPTGSEDHPTGPADNPTDADDHGATVSEVARTTEATGAEKGAAVSEAARAGHGPDGADDDDESTDDDATEVAEPGSQAPVVTPNPGGTGTASDASGGRSDVGTSRAPAQAAAGSANAAGGPAVDHPTADENPGSGRRP
jgi:hypothetical protein